MMRSCLTLLFIVLICVNLSLSAVCDDSYYNQGATLTTLTGDTGSMAFASELKIGPGSEDGIPKLDSINYKFPVQFTSTCNNYEQKPVTYKTRSRQENAFTDSEETVWVRFYSLPFADKPPAWFLFTLDTSTHSATEFIYYDTANGEISAVYAAGFTSIVEINQFGAKTGATYISWLDWDPYLDSAAAMEHLMSEFKKTALPTEWSQRTITVQILALRYANSVAAVGDIAVEQKGVKMSRSGGNLLITLPDAVPGEVMKIHAINGELIKELYSPDGVYEWDGAFQSGHPVPRGVYLFQAGDYIGKVYVPFAE